MSATGKRKRNVAEDSDTDEATRPKISRQTRINRNLLEKIEQTLEADSEADITSIIPPSYKSKIADGSRQPSKVEFYNRSVVDGMQKLLEKSPEIDLQAYFPKTYRDHYERKIGNLEPSFVKRQVPPPSPPKPCEDIVSRLLPLDTAKADIVLPLSKTVLHLISQYQSSIADTTDYSRSLIASFRELLQASETVFEGPGCAVLKCSPDLVAKVLFGRANSTECSSLSYLSQHSPDLPVPRLHGLVELGRGSVLFMSYVPGTTLEAAWPLLGPQQKSAVQTQLDKFFTRLRELEQPDGAAFGGIGGEGVVDLHREGYRNKDPIYDNNGFEDFKFSISHFASETYIKFLKTFLPMSEPVVVFTHGDLRPANIMVKMDKNHDCTLTGIIDWEYSGFYPDYHESTKCTNLLFPGHDSDWYEYLPHCVSPFRFPQWWLVDRLLDINIKLAL